MDWRGPRAAIDQQQASKQQRSNKGLPMEERGVEDVPDTGCLPRPSLQPGGDGGADNGRMGRAQQASPGTWFTSLAGASRSATAICHLYMVLLVSNCASAYSLSIMYHCGTVPEGQVVLAPAEFLRDHRVTDRRIAVPIGAISSWLRH